MKLKQSIIVDIIAMLFMILFLYTGVSKLMDYKIFSEQLSESPVLAPLSRFIAIALPALEIATAAFLLLPRSRLVALYTSLGLMVSFTIYIILILNFSNTLPCSCGGLLAELSWPQHTVFNIIFIIFSIIAIILERKLKKKHNPETASHAEQLQTT